MIYNVIIHLEKKKQKYKILVVMGFYMKKFEAFFCESILEDEVVVLEDFVI